MDLMLLKVLPNHADSMIPSLPDFGVGLASFHTKLTPEMENSLYSQL